MRSCQELISVRKTDAVIRLVYTSIRIVCSVISIKIVFAVIVLVILAFISNVFTVISIKIVFPIFVCLFVCILVIAIHFVIVYVFPIFVCLCIFDCFCIFVFQFVSQLSSIIHLVVGNTHIRGVAFYTA